jgi:hypothetical protein
MADTGATSNIAGAANAVNVATGLASSLSGVADAVTGTINAISSGVSNLFSSFGAGSVPSDLKLPIVNPLHIYSSYDYVISMGCLDTNSFNFPDSSYMAGKMPPLIFKGGGGDPNNRIKTAAGKFDFYCPDLTIKSQYGFEKGTGNTNSTNLEFTVIEPYSMGMFMLSIQQAAYQAGYRNFNEAPFLLIVEFRGADQNGVMRTIPKTKKFIPFTFNNMSLKVSGAGSVYQCVGVPCNAVSSTDSVRLLKTDITIKGKTVQEALQTGEASLQAALNAKYDQQKKEGLVNVPDEIVILFPTDIKSSTTGSSLSLTDAVESTTTATVNSKTQINDPKLFQQLQVSRSSTNKTLTQASGAVNELGKASLDFSAFRPQDASFPKDANTKDKNGNDIRANIKAPDGLVDMKFKIGTDIINAINQVMLRSEIAKVALAQDPDENGMRPWWRVDVQTYHISSNSNMQQTGTLPKVHVYRVIPYQVHASRLLPPNAPVPGIEKLKTQAAKVYNYIYTGKNADIIKFDIDISNTFYQVFAADNFSTTGDVRQASKEASVQNTDAGGDTTSNVNIKAPLGGTPPSPGIMATAAKYISTLLPTDAMGGSRGETEATRAAKLFHDALINGMDMMNITLDIVGDPYYIANSGVGNYTATQTNLINVTKDGDVNYQNGEVDIVINFRTPTDINQTTGMYSLTNTKMSQQFSGLYKLTTITSFFKNGKFTQQLVGNRRQGQDSKDTPSAANLLTSKAAPLTPVIAYDDDGNLMPGFQLNEDNNPVWVG